MATSPCLFETGRGIRQMRVEEFMYRLNVPAVFPFSEKRGPGTLAIVGNRSARPVRMVSCVVGMAKFIRISCQTDEIALTN